MMRRLQGGRGRSGGDEGAILVVVLIVLTVLSLGLSALLTFADTGERTTVAMTTQAATMAEANGAVEVAMNALRRGQYNNSPGQSCFGGTDTLTLSNVTPSVTGGAADSAAVTCGAAPGTGGSGSLVPITSSNKPGSAVQTLSTSGSEDGIQVKSLGGGSSNGLKVHGQVVSNSTVTVTSGKLVVDNGVYATGACTLAGITSTPAASCNRGTTVADPGYPSETPSLTYRPLSSVACSTPNSVVSFQPGYYDDAAGLTAMMAGNSDCKHSTWWFRPGVYYFDFHNGENPALPGGSHQWVVDDGTLVAGTPSGGAAQPPVNPTLPGACVSPITSTTAVGVQFIFGGDSRLQVDAGKAEICASYHSDRPPIAVYGQRTGSPSVTGPVTLTGTSATSSKFTTPGGALAPNDGSIATWNGSGSSATLTVNGLATGSSVPAGSQLTAATLAVRRMNTKGNKNDTVTVTLTPAAGGSPVAVSVPTSGTTAWQDTTTDLMSTTLPDAVHTYGFTSASALYSVTPKTSGGTESLDGVQLTLTYTLPALRAQNATINGSPSCVAKVGYGSGGTCAALSTTSAPGSVVYIEGTAYLPLAAVDITLNNVSSQVFKFGVVARVLAVKINGSSTFDQAVIELPDNSPGYGFSDTDLLLTAYVCPGSATCSPGSTPVRLRARVRITDPSGSVVPGQRQIRVTSWSLSH